VKAPRDGGWWMIEGVKAGTKAGGTGAHQRRGEVMAVAGCDGISSA
jgi:hypothetical protein